MMTKEQRDNWFSHHEPTSETEPKYALINAAENGTVEALQRALGDDMDLQERLRVALRHDA